jgi:two-component system, chemotaxis family, response regulator Rcp1
MAQQADPKKPLQILLADDNPADVRMTREALAFARIAHELHVVGDGEQALAFLRREGEYADAPRPDLMLLDLSMPGLGGHHVLEALRDQPPKQRIPVVVITGSKLQSDLERSFALNADTQIMKPAGLVQWAAELTFAVGLVHPSYG